MNPQTRQTHQSAPKRRILAAEHPYERLLVRALAVILVALMLLYIYFVSMTTLNVIARQEALRRTDDLTTSIASLEQQYFALSSAVTPSMASSLGLEPVTATAYVDDPGTVGMVSTAH